MQILSRPYGALHYRLDGPTGAPVVLMANSLGTDLRLWEAVLPLLSDAQNTNVALLVFFSCCA